jgi:hypothetical protein
VRCSQEDDLTDALEADLPHGQRGVMAFMADWLPDARKARTRSSETQFADASVIPQRTRGASSAGCAPVQTTLSREYRRGDYQSRIGVQACPLEVRPLELTGRPDQRTWFTRLRLQMLSTVGNQIPGRLCALGVYGALRMNRTGTM